MLNPSSVLLQVLEVKPPVADVFYEVMIGAARADGRSLHGVIVLSEPYQSFAHVGAGSYPGSDCSWMTRKFVMKPGAAVALSVVASGEELARGVVRCFSSKDGTVDVVLDRIS